jgi:hypothetical protein
LWLEKIHHALLPDLGERGVCFSKERSEFIAEMNLLARLNLAGKLAG